MEKSINLTCLFIRLTTVLYAEAHWLYDCAIWGGNCNPCPSFIDAPAVFYLLKESADPKCQNGAEDGRYNIQLRFHKIFDDTSLVEAEKWTGNG